MSGAFLLTAVVLGALVIPWWSAARTIGSGPSAPLRVAWLLALLGAALLLARPHGETVLGLDTSGYRLMSEAITEGRPLRGTDSVLREVPESLRTAFLFLPNMDWRNTRDISFQVLDIHSCQTAPFFYPWLPLVAAGFDHLLPGAARDYFVPLVGWLFFAVVLTAGAAWGGWGGLGIALALLLGTPLPAWFFRGFYPEAVASILVGLGLLAWSRGGLSLARLATVFAGLGLALSFHPLLVVLVAPAAVLVLLTEPMGWRRLLLAGPSFLAGFAPLYLMTRYVCQPYGDIFNWQRIRFNVFFDGKHAAVVSFTGLALALVLVLAMLPRPLWQRLHDRACSFFRPPVRSLLLLALSLLPLAAILCLPAARPLVLQGWREVYSGTRIPLLLLAAVLVLVTMVGRAALRPRLLVVLLLAALPVFLYLKGSEPTGFWSQRRWLPVLVLMVVALLPAASAWSARWRGGRALRLVAGALILLAAGANAARWPAPYWTRSDHDGDAWRHALAEKIGDRWTFFDYYHRSFSFAVGGRLHALGLGGQSWSRLPEVMAWLSPRAQREPFLVATAYQNPGLEENVELASLGVYSTQVTRVRSKKALPAEQEFSTLSVELLEARPARAESPPALHKVMDGGPLALRGPWLPKTQQVRSPAGEPCTAMWGRTGAGILGPVPPRGGGVELTVVLSAGRRSDTETVRVRFVLPWGGHSDWVVVSNEARAFALPVRRPTEGPEVAAVAVYGLESESPYDPHTEGIRSYPSDLIALVQRIDIAVTP